MEKSIVNIFSKIGDPILYLLKLVSNMNDDGNKEFEEKVKNANEYEIFAIINSFQYMQWKLNHDVADDRIDISNEECDISIDNYQKMIETAMKETIRFGIRNPLIDGDQLYEEEIVNGTNFLIKKYWGDKKYYPSDKLFPSKEFINWINQWKKWINGLSDKQWKKFKNKYDNNDNSYLKMLPKINRNYKEMI